MRIKMLKIIQNTVQLPHLPGSFLVSSPLHPNPHPGLQTAVRRPWSFTSEPNGEEKPSRFGGNPEAHGDLAKAENEKKNNHL